MNYKVVRTHITNISPGDTIRHNGHLKTVTKCNITFSKFMGVALFGDNYNSGHKQVEKVIILHVLPTH